MAANEVNSLHKAIDILMLMRQEQKELGVSEIGRHLGLNKATVHRILSTFESRGLVQQNNDTGKYWLGIKLYSLGMAIDKHMPIKAIVAPYAKNLSEKFSELCHVGVLDMFALLYPQVIIIEKIQTNQLLTYTPPPGSSIPCHCSSLGKCLLAHAPADYIKKYLQNPLPRLSKNTITDWDELFKELDTVRINGYAIDDDELEEGLFCIASPIFGRNKTVVAAISLSGQKTRMKSDRFFEIVEEVKRTAKNISLQLQ